MTAFDLSTCARPNILKLVPYRCARDDYKDDGTNILLDANENAFGPSLPSNLSLTSTLSTLSTSTLHRYPDPHQHALKQKFCNLRGGSLTPSNLFLGVGSDEAIDALLRAFCIPGKDKILTCPPTYGMYAVSACVNDIDIVKVPLKVTEPGFPVDVDAIEKVLSETEGIKLVYLCSPGNPTGSLVDPEAVKRLLAHPTWNGIVIVDEAYVDFASQGSSLAPWVTEYPNLVVMQTLSKAFGMAGIRLGAAFTSVEIARLLNSLKAPYSISSPTSELAMAALTEEGGLKVQRQNVERILRQRDRLVKELPKIEGIGRFLGGFESNFLLCEMLDKSGKPSNFVAEKVYAQLAETRGVVVRFRGKELGCEGCLRITIGTEEENDKLLERLAEVLKRVREE